MVKNNVKRVTSLLVVLLFVVVVSPISHADVYDLNTDTEHVMDNDKMLSDSELMELEDRIQKIEEKYGAEHLIILNKTRDWSGKTGQKNQYAKELYRDNGYGYGDDNTGSVLLVDFFPPAGQRNIEIVTFGRIVDKYQPKVDDVISNLGKKLAAGEVYEAVNYYLDTLEDTHSRMGTLNESGEFESISFISKIIIQSKNIFVYLIALVIAIIVTLVPLINYRGKDNVTYMTYEAEGNFNLSNRSDIFSHSHTTRTKRADDSSSSGSSGGTGGGSGTF